MAEVEILLGTYNGARHLGPQLASFAGQSLSNWTLHVSDDGSTDETRAILGRFAKARPGAMLRVINGPKAGIAANYLHLLQKADRKASFIALSDQDDIWFPQKLHRAVTALRQLPGDQPAIYAATSTLIDHVGAPIRCAPRQRPSPNFQNALVQNVCAGHTIVLNRRAADLAARAVPTTLPPFHDWWLYALMAGVGADIVIDAEPVLAYRQHDFGFLGAHSGSMARLVRLNMVLNGIWRDWLIAHHRALASVAHHLRPQYRTQLIQLCERHGRYERSRLFHQLGAHRQQRFGTAMLGLAALAGLA